MCEYARVRESSREFAANTRKFSGRYARVRESSQTDSREFAKVLNKFSTDSRSSRSSRQIREVREVRDKYAKFARVRESSREFARVRESSRRIRESSRRSSQRFAKVLNQFSTNSHIRMEVRKDIRLIHIGYPQFAAANLRMGDATPVMY